ncbi:hypothetical protein H0H92_008848 [Tricholoma furcatifolium]|nr:hypothetical protein H0H92_008848 [Tricholoma furcatifolium]
MESHTTNNTGLFGSIIDFLERSSFARLISFNFISYEVDKSPNHELFRELLLALYPCVKLSITGLRVSEEHLEHISSGLLLPGIQSLELDVFDDPHPQALLSMVERRLDLERGMGSINLRNIFGRVRNPKLQVKSEARENFITKALAFLTQRVLDTQGIYMVDTHSLPAPEAHQAYCNVSALEGGFLDLNFAHFTTSITSPETMVAPSLAFLLRHSSKNDNFLFDLGIRRNWDTYPPQTLKAVVNFGINVPQDVVESLAKGGLSPSDISTICLSQAHFDHVGDTKLFPGSIFLVGEETKRAISPEYNDLLVLKELPAPRDRINFLSTAEWQPLGPFPRALDFYGDGSLYIIDAAGHLPGHINVLARTSADGSWIYLAGDSAHHWDLVTGKGEIAVHEGQEGFFRCAYHDKAKTEQHLARMRELLAMPRVQVLLAHDIPWYSTNKGGPAFWPGKIPPAL